MEKIICLFRKSLLLGCMLLTGFYVHLNAQSHIQHIRTAHEGINFVQHSTAKYSSSEYVVAGTVTPAPISGSSDILVLMADNAGNVLWKRYLDYGFDEFVGAVIVDSQENIVLTGYTGTNNTGNKKLIIVTLDGNGNYVNDVVIHDAGTNGYGLYGLDVVETNGDQLEYIVVGTGVDNATAASQKYAFVLKYVPGGGIPWGRIYQSQFPVSNTQFDSFNHILKVDDHADPTIREVYLLTGSGATTVGDQMVTNDLIDPYNNGLSVWTAAQGHRELDLTFNNFGAMSLYQQSSNEFYVLYYGKENVPSLMVMDGTSGSGSNYVSFYPWQGNFSYQNNLVNGMVWSDSGQEEIVLSGYHLYPSLPPGTGFPFFARFDLFTGSLWTEHPTQFDGAAYQNIAFDFIVRPINHANATHPEMINQIYYRPKALVRRSTLQDYIFAEPWQDKNTLSFGLALFQTNSNGEMNCSITVDGLEEGAILNSSNNFVSSPYPFEISKPGLQLYNANLVNMLICQNTARPFMGTNEGVNKFGLKIYPNPATDYLTVSGLSKIGNAKITLYDMQGRVVLSKTYVDSDTSNETSLNVSTLKSGVYFVTVSSKGTIVFTERAIFR